MGLLDWVLKPFRGRVAEPVADASNEERRTADPARVEHEARVERPTTRAEQKAARAAAKAAQKKALAAQKKAAQKEAAAEKKGGGSAGRAKGKKKARKAAAARPSPPRAEVLSVEEAERRYGALVRAARPSDAPPAEEEVDEADAPTARPAAPRAVGPRSPRPEGSPPAEVPARDLEAEQARRAEAAENRRRARVPRYEGLIARADALLAVPDADPRHLRSARDELVEGWRALGAPPPEQAEALNAARDARIAALDARCEAAFAVLDEQRRENLAQKMAIVEEARALAEREDLKGAGPAMGQLRSKLRAVGSVSAEDHAAVTAAFAEAEARLKARQEAIREDREIARREALERLDRLVRTAESLVSAPDAEQAAERVKGLQAQWKTVRVPGPRAEVDAFWARFRGACDAVFARRAEARVEAARVTLDRMEDIVQRAETLAREGTDGDPEDVIHKLLNDWKRAGRAPREARDALWDRLQHAFDHLRSPPVDLPADAEDPALVFRPFEGLSRDEER